MERYEQTNDLLEIKEFSDVRGIDLSVIDLSSIPKEVLEKTNFDTFTKWPDADKLPEGFDPEKIIEESKNPGLGIRELHKDGVNGYGVTVAIIDQALSSERGIVDPHDEYSSNIIDYKEFGMSGKEQKSMHGPAVASLLVGKSCGIAPEARLVYRAVKSNERDFNLQADALVDIIELNKTLPEKDRVRVVSCSIGYMESKPEPGLDRWISTIKKAEAEGIIVSDVGKRTGVEYLGGGASGDKESVDSYESWLYMNVSEFDEEIAKLVLEKDAEGIFKRLKEVKGEGLVGISDEQLKSMIEFDIKNGTKRERSIIVPSDHRAMASRNGAHEYMYNGRGGISWSVPYLSGIFALVFQIKPDLKKEQIAEIITNTAIKNKKGLKVINPKGIIEEVKKMV